MAAFIQKFLNRKKPTPVKTPEPKVNQQETTEKLEKTERQDERRQQQLDTLAGSPSQAELESLAINGLTADIRLSAARAIADKDSLQRVQKQAKGSDKGVYQTVRQALQRIRDQEAEQQRKQQAISTLIDNARDQARSDDTKLYEPRLNALLKQWAELAPDASESQTDEFSRAVADCRTRLDQLNAEKALQAQAEEQKSQRAETLTLLERTIADLKQPSTDSEPSLAALDALQKTQENRWLEATRDTDVDRQEQKRYEALMLPLRLYISACKRVSQNRDQLQALVSGEQETDSGPLPSAPELLATIDWPTDFPMPPLVQQLARKAGEKPRKQPESVDTEQQKVASEKLQKTLDQLSQTLEARQLKESKQLFKTAQQQFKQLDRRHAQPFQPKLQLCAGQLHELTDWHGFATRPKQIALCEQMEYLAEQPMEPEAKAERIKELQNEWRALGGSSDRELWARFKQASDQAFEPCKEYFSAKSGLKQANLETRKAIVDQLKTFIDNADWQNIDWKAAERIHQKAREEWKAAWPIEFRDNRPVQKAFDELLKQLEQPLNEERRKNEALKQAIVEKAEALIDHEPLAEAMNQAKALQADWQQVGITRHREDRKLWQAFRKACDRIFARRDAAKNEEQEQTRIADEKASAVLEQTRQLGVDPPLQSSSDPQSGQMEDPLIKGLESLKALSGEPLSREIQNRVRQELSRLEKAIQARQGQRKLAQWQNHIHARVNGNAEQPALPEHWRKLANKLAGASAAELVIRAEILAQIPSPAEEQSQRMEIQVQRLADGMGAGDAGEDNLAQMEALVAAWCLQPEDDSITQSRANRLTDALATAVNQQT